MKVFIYGAEGRYQGLHGICIQTVVDVESIEEADEYAYEELENLVERYGLDDEDEEIEQEFYWCVYKIKDEITLTTRELDGLCNTKGMTTFVFEYCEPNRLD